jgi:hypothetical protein
MTTMTKCILLAACLTIPGYLFAPAKAGTDTTPPTIGGLNDPGFEDGTSILVSTTDDYTRDCVAQDQVWCMRDVPGQPIMNSVDCTVSRSGSCSLELIERSWGGNVNQRVATNMTGNVSLSFWYLDPSGGSSANKWFTAALFAVDASGAMTQLGTYCPQTGTCSQPVTTWALVSLGPYALPAGTVSVHVNFATGNGCGCTGAEDPVWVDDVTLLGPFGPQNITAEATSAQGAVVTYESPTTHDPDDPDGVATCAPSGGTTFPLGQTTVTCTATDPAGNAATPVSFVVAVVDTTPPTIDSHADVTAEASGPSGARVAYTPPATHDAVDGNGTATCTPASASTFPLGATTVTCSASDAHGNAAAPTAFEVHVVDTTPPTLELPANMSVQQESVQGANVTFNATAMDLVDGVVPVACAPASGSLFPLGNTTVNCTASDTSGNAATENFSVSVLPSIHANITMIDATYDEVSALLLGVNGQVFVFFPNGDPVSGAHVVVSVVNRVAPFVNESENGTTDDAGSFNFTPGPLFELPGDYDITATATWNGAATRSSASYLVQITVPTM